MQDDTATLQSDENPTAPDRGPGITPVLGALVTAVPLIWALDLLRSFGIVFYDEQFLAIILGLALALTYIAVPMRKADAHKVPWYDWVAAVLGFGAGVFTATNFARISLQIALMPTDSLICAAILVVLCMEGLRRTVGLPLLIVAVVFMIYGLIGHLAPDVIAGRQIAAPRLLLYIAFDQNGLLGLPANVIASVLVAFMFLGTALAVTNGTGFFTDLSVVLMGRYRGGAAKISVLSSALFGSVSGSSVANVVATGVVTIPLMKRSGYSKEQSGAIEAVASTGGQLMPPVMGAGAFLMAEFLRVPYSDIAVAALIPALLYYGALLLVVDLEAAKANIPPVSSEGLPSAGRILIDGWSFIATFAIIIFLMFGMHMSPGMAAALGTGFLLVVNLIFGYRGKRINLRQVFDTFAVTGTTVLGIIMIGAVASFVIGVLNVTGLGYALTLLLINLGGNQVGPLLILAALAAIVLGMGMPTVAVYALLGVLIAPSMVQAGIEPIAAHMFVFYFGILSGVTPPVAVAAFAAAHVANGDPFRTCFHAMCFGWSAYIVPFLFVLSPSLLLIGAPGEVTLAVVTAFAGVALATAGMAAYLFAPLGLVQRVLMFIAGIAIMIPANTFPGAIYTDIGGSVLGAILLGFNWHARATSPDKRKPAPVVASVTSGNP